MRDKSTLKSARQDVKRGIRNHAQKSRYRTEIKKLEALLATGKKAKLEQLQGMLNTVQCLIMRAARKNIIKKNTASRTIARLSLAISRHAS
jgi:small subunit ribosomal protein S20